MRQAHTGSGKQLWHLADGLVCPELSWQLLLRKWPSGSVLMPSPELWVSCKVSEGGWEKREEESGCGIFRSWTCALYLSGNRNISGSWRRQADLSSSGKGRWLWYSSFPLRTVGLDRALMVPLSEDCARNVWICDSNCPKEPLQKEALPRRRDSKMVTWGWGLSVDCQHWEASNASLHSSS